MNHTLTEKPVAIIVDDEEGVRMVVAHILHHDFGARTLEADTAEMGVYHLDQEERVDYLISDLEGLGLPGDQLLRMAKDPERFNHPDLVTFLMSGNSSNIENLAAGCGANGYCAKPFTYDEFIRAFRVILDSKIRSAA